MLAAVAAGLVAAVAIVVGLTTAGASSVSPDASTATPIKHIVVLFDENISFDHYFGTYPDAANPPGEPSFTAKPGTPSVNGLTSALLTSNPNLANPHRLDRSDPVTCDQDHAYGAEQSAFDGGAMDKFVQFTAGGGCTQLSTSGSSYGNSSTVMGYYDGNTVTAMWNYAQNFALNDNSFDTQFGPSTPGALNLISGDTSGASPAIAGTVENGTMIGDADPANDDCSGGTTASMSGQNIGNLLNTHNVTWGWFEGGFTPTGTVNSKATCGSAHANVAGASVTDYVPHHEPFQYYASTANPHHLPPSSVSMIGSTDQANHQYDLSSFDAALANGNLPAVSFLKAPAYEDGHAGYSDPLDEQRFLVDHINEIEQSPDWSSTAIIIAYDDSDGWYDHQVSDIVRPSAAPSDSLNGPGKCGTGPPVVADGCGYGPRLPLLVISPWAKQNFVDNTQTDQTSIISFIEQNWSLGRIGGGSADAIAGSLDNMFDFSPNDSRAPAVILSDSSGEQVASPTSSTSSTSTVTTATQTTTTTGKPAPKKTSPPPAVTCRIKRSSAHKISFTCRLRVKPKRKTTLLLRLELRGKVLASARGKVRGTSATIVLNSRRKLTAGRYTLVIADITARAPTKKLSQTVRVK